MKKITVLVVDDHPLIREGLRMLLATAGDIEVVGEAADGRGAIQCAKKLQPDVILMDLSMPVMNGFEATKQIHAQVPCANVLVLSSYGEVEMVAQSIANGAKGFVIKQSAASELLKGIREAAQGRLYFCRAIASRLAKLNREVYAGRIDGGRPAST